jgi:pimeloyl-ACP methyl ester carboxylesterase
MSERSLRQRDVDAAPVAWREAGSGPLVLFRGGLGMTRTGFDPQLAALSSGYRCVAWDMPGYGASPLPPQGLSFALLADAVATLIGTLGEPQAHLAGLSMGGQVALHAALRHPRLVRSLALLDSSPAFGLDGTEPEAWKRLRLDPLDAGETPASMAERVLRSVMAPGAGDGAVAAAVASMSRIPAEGLRAAVECLPTHDVRARLGEIAAPTLGSSASTTRKRRSRTPRRWLPASGARACRSFPVPATSRTWRPPRPSTPRCGSISPRPRSRHDRVALARGLRPSAACLRAP